MKNCKNQGSTPNFQIFDKSQGKKKNGQQKNGKADAQVEPTGFFKHNGIIMEAFFTYLNQASSEQPTIDEQLHRQCGNGQPRKRDFPRKDKQIYGKRPWARPTGKQKTQFYIQTFGNSFTAQRFRRF